jgi:hypothetical protein
MRRTWGAPAASPNNDSTADEKTSGGHVCAYPYDQDIIEPGLHLSMHNIFAPLSADPGGFVYDARYFAGEEGRLRRFGTRRAVLSTEPWRCAFIDPMDAAAVEPGAPKQRCAGRGEALIPAAIERSASGAPRLSVSVLAQPAFPAPDRSRATPTGPDPNGPTISGVVEPETHHGPRFQRTMVRSGLGCLLPERRYGFGASTSANSPERLDPGYQHASRSAPGSALDRIDTSRRNLKRTP